MKNVLWNELMNMFSNSYKDIIFYTDNIDEGERAMKILGISSDSVLGSIILNTSGIEVDNWIRVLGHNSINRKGILQYNLINEKGIAEKIENMLIIGYDVVGGIFALNAGLFSENIGYVYYFAPDTLEWESMDMKYSEFIVWTINGNTDEFYSNMFWKNRAEDIKNIKFDECLLIYPFLWSKEIQIDNAEKKIISFEELFNINMEYSKKFGLT